MNYEEFTPEQLKEQHQHGMMEDLMRTSNKWAKEHGINMKDIPPDEPKREREETLTLEMMDIRLKRVEKMLFNSGT